MADLLRRLETEKRLLDSLSEYVILIGVVQKDTTRKKVVASVGLTTVSDIPALPQSKISNLTTDLGKKLDKNYSSYPADSINPDRILGYKK